MTPTNIFNTLLIIFGALLCIWVIVAMYIFFTEYLMQWTKSDNIFLNAFCWYLYASIAAYCVTRLIKRLCQQ